MICKLQSCGLSCNLSHKCSYQLLSETSLWLEKCKACSSNDWGVNQMLPAGLLWLFYLGLKFNCVFAALAVAPVSDETDVWIAVWHFSCMKIYGPSEPFVYSSMFFLSIIHNNKSSRIDRQCQRTSRGELWNWGLLWFFGYHHKELWHVAKVHWHFIDPYTASSVFACAPQWEVRSGWAVEHCPMELVQI